MSESTVEGGDAEPTCPRHPGVVSYVRCQRCGRPTCPTCQRVAPVGIHCIDCVTEARARQKPVKSAAGFVVRQKSPIVTITIIAINVVVFVLGSAVWGNLTYQHLGLYPEYPFDEPWRWVTSAFTHFGVLHVGFNMLALWQFGSRLESQVGVRRFAALYGASLLGSSALVAAIGEDGSVHMGASGAIYGVVVAALVVDRWMGRSIQHDATFIGLFFLAGFFITGLSWEAHLGGAIIGGVCAFAFLRPRRSRIKG